LNGYKFVRQYSTGSYSLDFYCPSSRLAIELDGSQHANKESINYDEKRKIFLNSHHIKVLRFWNYEVRYDIDKVLKIILKNLNNKEFSLS